MKTCRQLALFEDPAQPQSGWLESLELYSAVLFLRRRGYRVYRISSWWHHLDRARTSTPALFALAREKGWNGA